MPFSKMSNNDLKSFLHVENPIFYRNSSIKTMPKKTREMMKLFCQMNQVFDDNENEISFDYCSIDDPNKLNMNMHNMLHLNICYILIYLHFIYTLMI